MKTKTSQAIEITLPSGTFAKVRPIRFVDRLIANAAAAAAETMFKATPGDARAGVPMYVPCIVARSVLFDDKSLSLLEVLDLDNRDTDAVLTAMLPYLSGPIT